MSTREERKKEILKAITDAAAAAQGVDWTRHSDEIVAAEAEMEEAIDQYINEQTSKANVRTVYQKWRDLHKTAGVLT